MGKIRGDHDTGQPAFDPFEVANDAGNRLAATLASKSGEVAVRRVGYPSGFGGVMRGVDLTCLAVPVDLRPRFRLRLLRLLQEPSRPQQQLRPPGGWVLHLGPAPSALARASSARP